MENTNVKEPVDFQAIHNEWKRQLPKDEENNNRHMIDFYNVNIGTKVERGKIKRKPINVTINANTLDNWADFLEVYSGVEPSKGRGLSSQFYEMGMKMVIEAYTEVYVEEIASKIVQSLNSTNDIERIVENLESLITELRKHR